MLLKVISQTSKDFGKGVENSKFQSFVAFEIFNLSLVYSMKTSAQVQGKCKFIDSYLGNSQKKSEFWLPSTILRT